MKFTSVSLSNPFVQLVLILLFVIIVLAILRMSNTPVGLGAHAQFGRLRGSFNIEGYESKAKDEKKAKDKSKNKK